jgi:MtrB/PioB family decaheme-associated outer membrane protein
MLHYGTACLAVSLALPGLADEQSEEWRELVTPARHIEIGLGAVHGGTGSLANATGLDTRDGYLVAGFDLRGAPPLEDDGNSARWRLRANELGQEERALAGEYGIPGRYRLEFKLDRIRHHGGDDYQTPFLGIGGDHLTLPEGVAQADTNTQTGAAPLAQAMHPVDLATTRQRARLAARLNPARGWEFQASASQDSLTGTRPSGVTLGTGGSSIGMILPEPVDSVTRRIEASLAYQQPGRYLRLDYRGAFYNNDLEGYGFQSPFAIPNTLLENRMGLAPDNQAHQMSLSGAYSLGATTRLSASAAYGRLTQDADFLPYSTAAGAPALPRASLDGEVVTRQARVRLTSRPTRDLRLNASYRYDDRDNRTPVSTYTLPGVSSAHLGEVGGANVTLDNTPYSRTTSQTEIETGWDAGRGRDLSLTLRRETVARDCHGETDCVEVPETREHAWRLEWRENLTAGLSARLGLSQALRRGDDYQRYADSVELAGMRKFFLADRDRGQVRARVHADLGVSLSLDMTLDLNRDSYMNSPYGLRSADSRACNIDLGYALDGGLDLNLYAGRETLASRLYSSYSTRVAAPGVSAEMPDAQWQARLDDTVDIFGLGVRRRGWPSERLDLEADLVLLRARTPYLITGGALSASSTPLAPEPLPRMRSDSIELRLGARYALDSQANLRASYLYRRLSGDDYALDLYRLDSVPRLLGSEEHAPAHQAHALAVSYELRFH